MAGRDDKPDIFLNDGNRIPVMGFGTYAPVMCPRNTAEEATRLAIQAGYRHIDGAYMHGNEAEVGRAIRKEIESGTIRRENLFYTGKLWGTFHHPDHVREGLEKSRTALGLDIKDKLDLFLIHSPIEFEHSDDIFPENEDGTYPFKNTDLRDTWKEMEKCKDEGLVKSIGVSNFNRRQLEQILNMPGLKHKPVCNQVECHIYLNQTKLLKFCKSKDIVLVAYGALGSSRDESRGANRKFGLKSSAQFLEDGRTILERKLNPIIERGTRAGIGMNYPVLLDDEKLNKIARRINKTPAQVAINFLLQRGIVVLAKSFTPHRIKENLQALNFTLGKKEMKSLEKRNKNIRYNRMSQYKTHPRYPFDDEY